MRRRFVLVPLAALLFPCASLIAQDALNSSSVSNSAVTVRYDSAKALTISGVVSDDGATLVTDRDDLWTVSNPLLLFPYRGREVTLKCRVNKSTSALEVLVIRLRPTRDDLAYKADDSAFRR